MKKLSFLSLLLVVALLCTSCVIKLPTPPSEPEDPTEQIPQGPEDEKDPEEEKDPIKDAEIKDDLEDWNDSSSLTKNTASITVIKDVVTDVKALVGEGIDLDGATWQSECESIATVDNGSVLGKKCGRCDVTVTDLKGNSATVTVTVEFLVSSNNGYDFNTVKDDTVYKVQSEYEANRLVDRAIANHVDEITLDFSLFGNGYLPFEDLDLECEFGNHVSLIKKYYESKPHILYVEIKYDADAATTFVDKTAQNSYNSLANGNMIIRMDEIEKSLCRRSADYEGFAINTKNNGEMDVYNSEELWWALEQNYKPRFAMENSKAELFYERAKMILREIITLDMTELEKVIAIAEYLTDAVAYDYDSFYQINADESDVTTNMCYYLEGVFERGVAVCDGKSKAFVIFCRIEGIECVRDFGSDPYGGAGHAWNYVKLDGEWYMVDTTGTDSGYGIDGSIGAFFGKNVELMSYDTLLNSVFDHEDEYIYSEVYTSITDSSIGESRTLDVFENKIGGTRYDLNIGSEAELTAVVAMLVSSELCDSAALMFICDDGVDVFDAIDAALEAEKSDGEYEIYTVGELEVYLLIIKNI